VNAGDGWGSSSFGTNLTNCNATGVCGVGGLVYGVPSNQALGSALGTGRGGRGSGFVGGGQIGYNWQFGSVVLGLEGDIDSFRHRSTLSGSGVDTTGNTLSVLSSTKSDWLATIRPRAGVTWGQALLYVTGGVAFTNLQYTQSMTSTLAASAGALSVSQTKTGSAIGGGAEYAFSNKWSAKLEYLHVEFGGLSGSYVFASTAPAGFSNVVNTATGHLHEDIVRVGLNYRPF
jgi:outer membrane immunogenic protein